MGIDPVSLAIIGGSMAMAGGAASAYSSFSAGQAARRADDYQAKLNRDRAAQAEASGYVQQRQSDIQFGNVAARATTGMASNGLAIGQGSAADYATSAAAQHATEKDIIGRNAGMQEFGFEANAAMDEYNGRMAARAGTMNAAGSMLQSAGSAASMGANAGMFSGGAPSLTGGVQAYGAGNAADAMNSETGFIA